MRRVILEGRWATGVLYALRFSPRRSDTTLICICTCAPAAGAEDVTRELAAAASAAEMPHEVRRQMYHEAHAFKHLPLFTQKVGSVCLVFLLF